VICDIKMQAVLRESVGEYGDLVTRPTGRAVRERIERTIAAPEADPLIARMDFAGVGCLDYSCADEIVAKLLRDRVRFLLLVGLTDGHREAIEPVLQGHRLAVVIQRDDGTLDAIGEAAAGVALLRELVERRMARPTEGGAIALVAA